MRGVDRGCLNQWRGGGVEPGMGVMRRERRGPIWLGVVRQKINDLTFRLSRAPRDRGGGCGGPIPRLVGSAFMETIFQDHSGYCRLIGRFLFFILLAPPTRLEELGETTGTSPGIYFSTLCLRSFGGIGGGSAVTLHGA